VLYGNSPRFSWVPSSTMLLNRLMALQSLRCLSGPNDSNSTEQGRFWRMTDQANGARTIFCPHGEPATGPTLLLKMQVWFFRFRRLHRQVKCFEFNWSHHAEGLVADADGDRSVAI
jgi:hypothetical protein